jgi:uncharacterized protein
MLKAPRAGFVKTRLARDIGETDALAAYRVLVERQMAALPEDWTAFVSFAPQDAEDEMRSWLGPDVQYLPQCDGDLGTRLDHVARMLTGPLIFLGGDCPALTRSRLIEATEALESADLVIWPAEDGGYCLLGFRHHIPEIFSGVSWGTESVLQETLDRVPVGVTLCVMSPPLEDVDDLFSWQRALASGYMRTLPESETTYPPIPPRSASRATAQGPDGARE